MTPQHTQIKGSGVGKFAQGQEVVSITGIWAGELLADYSPQFNALNLLKVLSVAEDRSHFHGIFVDPQETAKLRMGGDGTICVWDFEIGGSTVFHRVRCTHLPPSE